MNGEIFILQNRIDKTSIKTRNELWKGSNDAEMIVTKIKLKDRFLHVLEIIAGSRLSADLRVAQSTHTPLVPT